jgi:hypothetical protein
MLADSPVSRSVINHGARGFAELGIRDSLNLPLHGRLEAAMYVAPAHTLHADVNFLKLVTRQTRSIRTCRSGLTLRPPAKGVLRARLARTRHPPWS